MWWGRGTTLGSFIPEVEGGLGRHQLFAVRTNGVIEIFLQWLAGKPPFDDLELRQELAARIGRVKGLTFDQTALEGRPNFSLRHLADPAAFAEFAAAMDWCVNQIAVGHQD